MSEQLQPGDKIIFYTDGLTEAKDHLNRQFEDMMLDEVLIHHSNKPIKEYVNAIYSELKMFTKSESFDDDVCIVGMEIL